MKAQFFLSNAGEQLVTSEVANLDIIPQIGGYVNVRQLVDADIIPENDYADLKLTAESWHHVVGVVTMTTLGFADGDFYYVIFVKCEDEFIDKFKIS